MRLDLLWWRHLRAPRPHVAEPQGYRVVALDSLYTATNTPFMTLLEGLWVVRDEETRVGQYFVREGQWHKAYAVEEVDEDDWFGPPRWLVQVACPVNWGMQARATKIAWLEDEMFPRTGGRA